MAAQDRMLTALATTTLGLAVLLTGSDQPESAPPPIPWEITGTSSVASPPSPETRRIELRALKKDGSLVLRSGASYLSRGDFYTNPGVLLEGTYYPAESVGVDLLSADLFFSSLNGTAEHVYLRTGYRPDSQKPRARLGTGARLAFAYGKWLIEAMDTVVHLDVSAGAHLGVLVTDQTVNPMADVALSLQVQTYRSLLLIFDLAWVLSYENRSNSSFASGPKGALGLGVLL